MSARDEILHRIHAALGDAPARVAVPRDYQRTAADPATVPARIALFTDRLHDYDATVVATTPDRVADAIAEHAHGRVRVAPALPWAVPGAQPDDAGTPATELDHVDTAVTACAAACAQTGTIALDASPDQGRRALTLIPDRHVCIVHTGQIVDTVPELVARLNPTAPITLISGPSATADIELKRVKGVHGPRQLVVILVDDINPGGNHGGD